MAAISSQISLVDRMSSPLLNITNALEGVISSLQGVDTNINNSFDSTVIDSARKSLDLANAEINEMTENLNKATNKQDKLNKEIQEGCNNMDSLTNGVVGMVAAYAGFQGIGKLVKMSDEYTQTTARLNMINDGLQTTEALQDKIFASSQRSRASYNATADAVAKLSLNASDAFKSNDETILFAENLNKLFGIAGTEQASVASATLQLTQALGSGVLRGEEFNAVFEAAPNIMQTVADYMGVPIGKLREMAKDGQITASVVKNALLSATDEINTQFESMPMTWGQVWTGVMNELTRATQPVLKVINALAQNWSILEPIVVGVTTALGLYIGALLIYKAITGVSAMLTAIHAASTALQSGATFTATAAQYGFNAALYACPLTWILLIIIAVIAAIYAIIAAINKVTGKTLSATGIIMGALATAGAFIWNLIIGVLNAIIQYAWTQFVEPWLGIIEWLLNVCNGGFNSFGDAVANLIGQIIGWFLSLSKVVTKIIDAIFGTDWTAGLNELQNEVTAWGKNENAITLDRNAPTIGSRIEYGDAWNAGYAFGEGIEDTVGGLFGDNALLDNSLEELTNGVDTIANTTGDIADSMDITSEELKYLRDLAERDTINRFTTAEIRIEQTNHNSINSELDIDGVVDKLTSGVNEAMEKATEGVHY